MVAYMIIMMLICLAAIWIIISILNDGMGN